LFVSFFPQLVAGPIERAGRLIPQILEPRTIDSDRILSGAWLVVWGLYKKVVIADHLAKIVDPVFAEGAAATGPEVLVATYAFAFQIYCDFSGYSDIARGVARWFGFELMVNFRRPYLAHDPSDLWRRWHISLSSWLRDYVYISLGGNRRGSVRTLLNLGVTLLLGGAWHGAAWTFVAWGGFHGAWLAAHRVIAPWLARVPKLPRVTATALGTIGTFHAVCLGWILFRADSLARAGELIGTLFANPSAGAAASWLAPMALLIAPLAGYELVSEYGPAAEHTDAAPSWLRAVALASLTVVIVAFGEDHGGTFIYFQF